MLEVGVLSSLQRYADFSRSPCRLDLGQSNIAHARMVAAISRLSHNVPAIEQAAGDGQQYMLHGTHLRHVLLDSFSPTSESTHSTPLQQADETEYVPHETLDHGSRVSKDSRGAFKDDMRIMSWAKRYMRPKPVRVEGDPCLPLNASQIRAIATMIGEGMSLIQGVGSPAHASGTRGRLNSPCRSRPAPEKRKQLSKPSNFSR